MKNWSFQFPGGPSSIPFGKPLVRSCPSPPSERIHSDSNQQSPCKQCHEPINVTNRSASYIMMELTKRGAVCSNCQNVLTRHIVVPPSPVPSLIHTNQIPSPPDAFLIRQAISKVDADLSQVNGDIAQVQLVLDRLLQNRRNLRAYRRDHGALISSIRCFPYELLSRIFLEALPTPDHSEKSLKALRRAVMFPGQVCKHWRDVVLSTPKVWSKITFVSESESNAALVQSCLSRSGVHPLSIYLSGRINLGPSKPTSPVLLDLIAQSDRWQDLVFQTTDAFIAGLRSARHRLSYLQTLSITNDKFETYPHTLDTFEIAPRLRSLTLGPGVSLTWLRIPWSQLTHCDIFTCQMTINGCFEVLDNSPNLVECTLALHYQGAVAHQPRPLIQHKHLRALSISIRKNLDIGPLLDNLTLPALQAFSIHCDNAAPWAHSQFLSLLSRSACLLLKLCLHFDFKQFADDELIHYLQLLPSLCELELQRECARTTLTSSFLVRLTRHVPGDDQNDCLLPNLRVLRLDIYSRKIGKVFADMIESRRCLDTNISGNVLLETVVLSERFIRLDKATISRLINCSNGGLNIYWEFLGSPSSERR